MKCQNSHKVCFEISKFCMKPIITLQAFHYTRTKLNMNNFTHCNSKSNSQKYATNLNACSQLKAYSKHTLLGVKAKLEQKPNCMQQQFFANYNFTIKFKPNKHTTL